MELRKSSYTISVKLEAEEDKYMLVHGYTGAIDIVSGNVIGYLDTMNSPKTKNAEVSESTFNALRTRGYLTEKTEDEEVEHVRKLANLLHQKDKILYKNFMFLVAYDCNFRCPYCYESKVLKNSRQWTKKVFIKEMVDRAFDAMLQIESNRKLHSSKITLYGGEPLLAQNKEIVEYIVNKGKELGYHFMAVTNGYDLDAFNELLVPCKIEHLQITIDGMKEAHDKKRVHFKTKSSFDKILANIDMALEQKVSISIRVNTDASNFDDIDKLDHLFKKLDFYSKGKLRIYSALLYDYTNSAPSGSSFLSQPEFNNRHKELAFKYPCVVSNVAELLQNAIINKGKINFASVFCGAQRGSFIFDPFGDIYSCWENVGILENKIGNYYNSQIKWTDVKDSWQNHNISTSFDCLRCKLAFLCRGGCMAKKSKKTGQFEPGFCNSFPITFYHSANLAYNNYIASTK